MSPNERFESFLVSITRLFKMTLMEPLGLLNTTLINTDPSLLTPMMLRMPSKKLIRPRLELETFSDLTVC